MDETKATDLDLEAPGYVPGGRFSESGRQAAIRSAFALVGSYFKKTGRAGLSSRAQLGRSDDDAGTKQRFLAALRFRAALAMADTLCNLIEQISLQPTFRYELVSRDTTHPTGSLDLSRWAQRLPVFDGEPTYPVLHVRRASSTPENTLAAYSILWMIQELEQSEQDAGAPPQSPESQTARDLVERLRLLLDQSTLRESLSTGAETLRLGSEQRLLAQVESRLRRREIGNPTPYQELYDLVVRAREDGPDSPSGTMEWSFYEEDFDPTLFELWCLHTLGQAISRELYVEAPAIAAGWTGSGISYRWKRPAGTITLYAQRSLSNLEGEDRKERWQRSDGTKLIGIPDITAVASPIGGRGTRIALIDAKLRQREGPPTQEMYKILGYFNNFGLDESPYGAILYYSPDAECPVEHRYTNSERDGQLISTALNPADELQSLEGIRPVAQMILEMLGIPPAEPSGKDENGEESAINQRLAEMKGLSVHLSPQTLAASRRRLRTLLGESCWEALDAEQQTMIATSEHVGFILDLEADFSGPVLGLCSPIEALFHSAVLEPAKSLKPDNKQLKSTKTFGSLLNLLTESLELVPNEAREAILEVLSESGADFELLASVLIDLKDINARFRIPAAHKEVLAHDVWSDAFHMVISGERALPKVVRALGEHNK